MHQGDHAGAAESLVCLLRLGDTLRDEPIIISQLVRMAIFSIFAERLQEYLAWGQADDANLVRLQAAVAEVDIPASFQRAMIGERAMANHTLSHEDLRSLDALTGRPPNGAPGADSFAWIPLNGTIAELRPGDAAMVLTTLTEMAEAAKHPFPEAAAEAAAAEGRLKDFFADDQKRLPWDRHLMAQLLLPAVNKAATATQERTALHRAIVAALAIERFRLAHEGKLPATLDELVPDLLEAVPIDPCDGKPLRLAIIEEGYVVYSVGTDKQDDGGLVSQGQNRGAGIGIKVLRLPSQNGQ
jgi:hypothetical protein